MTTTTLLVALALLALALPLVVPGTVWTSVLVLMLVATVALIRWARDRGATS